MASNPGSNWLGSCSLARLLVSLMELFGRFWGFGTGYIAQDTFPLLPVEPLNNHVLSASSVTESRCSVSPPVLLLSEWEIGARCWRLLLLSCTRVFKTLESSTGVCFEKNKHTCCQTQTCNTACNVSLRDMPQELTSRKEKSGPSPANAGALAPSADSTSVLKRSRLVLLWSLEESCWSVAEAGSV